MKILHWKLAVVGLCSMLVFSVKGQFTAGMEAGALAAAVRVQDFEGSEVAVDPFSISGMELGLFAGYKFKDAFAYPKLKLHYRQFAVALGYTLQLENTKLTVNERDNFRSLDLALLMNKDIGKWQFGLGPGISFYEWSLTTQHFDLEFFDVTEYQGGLDNHINNYSPSQLVYLDLGLSYNVFKKLSLYANAYLPVWNAQRQIATGAYLQDDSGSTELYSQVSFVATNISLGLRLDFL